MIDERERSRMLKAHSIGPKIIAYLDEIGIKRLEDLVGQEAETLAMRIDIALGHKHMNRLGIEALKNLVELAERECGVPKPGSAPHS